MTRKEIRTHILGSTFDEDAVKESYFSQVREDVEFLLLEIADAVHEVSPETEIGVMTTSYPSVTLDRNLNTFFEGLVVEYRLDGGGWQKYSCQRYWWMPEEKFVNAIKFADDLPYGKHLFELRVAHECIEGCTSCDCKILMILAVQ